MLPGKTNFSFWQPTLIFSELWEIVSIASAFVFLLCFWLKKQIISLQGSLQELEGWGVYWNQAKVLLRLSLHSA